MADVWIVFADTVAARVYRARAIGSPLTFVATVAADGRAREGFVERVGSGGVGFGPRAVADGADLATDRFAHRIAAVLDEGRRAGSFGRFWLVMPPRLVARVRAALGPDTERLLGGAIDQRLIHLDEGGVRERLAELC